MKKHHKKYRISVLLDMTDNSESVLSSAVELAKRVDGDIEVFHVKPATNLIKGDSQLSAIRTLNQDDRATRSALEQLISRVSLNEDFTIGYKLEYGNVRNRVGDYLAKATPDFLVLGKQRPKIGVFFESITDFVIDQVSHTHILILGNDNTLRSFDDINLGIFGDELAENDLDLILELKRDNEKPVRHFGISDEQESETRAYPWQKTVSYNFSRGSNAVDGLVSYVSRTNTQLLCISQKGNDSDFFKSSPIKSVIRKANVPLMILGG
ncbi:universal stress protein [Muricauda ruestringensis]|uniref:universal stress protein n=1 Tax=Flagellimonas ruestringensis TaxID=111501 RepID=UPI001CD1BFC8|nr:universal stress protein [Allomuricauda ruestringensis]MCA0959586.1 universal stress protein [Allomuricauda ruestringensis]